MSPWHAAALAALAVAALSLALLAAALWGLWRLLRPGVQAPAWRLPLGRPFPCAHRGGAHLYPENTLEAFEAAARWQRCRFMELDVRATADGVPVVIHDADVARSAGRPGAVHELTLAQLQALDAAATFTSVRGEPWAGRGVRIPTLAAVLQALPECWFSVDLKQRRPHCAAAVVEVIRRCGTPGHVLLGAEDWATFRRLHRLAPELPSFFSRRGVVGFVLAVHLGLLRWYRPPHNSLQMPERAFGMRLLTPRLLAAAHGLGIPVIVWTVNDRASMERLLELGVDGIITDRPDLLAEIIAARNA